MGLDFCQRSVAYAEKHKQPGLRLVHPRQTNGTKGDNGWGVFCTEQKFLVGLSRAGPRALPDADRVDTGGKGSFDQVRRAWEMG